MGTFLDRPLPDGDRLITIEQARQELAAALRGNRGVSRNAADGVMRAFVAKIRERSTPPDYLRRHGAGWTGPTTMAD